jgi:hypothetical protein
MAQAAGYVLNIAQSRREELLYAVQSDEYVAEAVPEFMHSRNAPLVCFVGFRPHAVTHLATGQRGVRAGTGLRRLNLRELIGLPRPLRHTAIVAAVESRMRSHVRNRLAQGGLLPPKSFASVVDAIRRLVPESGPALAQFSAQRRARIARLRPEALSALAYQKETVATALALAGVDRRPLQSWEPPTDAVPSSFLDGLPTARVREDAMVVADLMKVPGFELVRAMPYGAAVFEGDHVRLTVVLANRLPLEQQLGADLIYYNETFGAFVIVQYKAMEKADDGAVFRFPNVQLTDEIARMDRALQDLRQCSPNIERNGFRLLDNPFYLKFCSRLIFNPDDAGLVPGMYLPLDYWRLIEADPSLVGPGGGRQVTFGNVGRYFDNTRFITLVAGAWIGTTISQSEVLRRVIREIVGGGRALTLAVKTDTGDHDGV